MHALSGGTLRMKKSVYVPGVAPDSMIELPVSCFLIQHPQGNILFDTGCHPELASDSFKRIGGMAKTMEVTSPPGVNVIEGLRSLGMRPEDIDLVVNSHFHTDHCGCNIFFTSATIVCHRCELAAARSQNAERQGYFPVDWDSDAQFQEIDSEYDVFGDGRIVLVPLPGHTPGSLGALVTLDQSGAILMASDAASLRSNLDNRTVPRNTWDSDRFLKSLDEIQRIQRSGATIFFGHDAQQWALLERQRTFT